MKIIILFFISINCFGVSKFKYFDSSEWASECLGGCEPRKVVYGKTIMLAYCYDWHCTNRRTNYEKGICTKVCCERLWKYYNYNKCKYSPRDCVFIIAWEKNKAFYNEMTKKFGRLKTRFSKREQRLFDEYKIEIKENSKRYLTNNK